MKDGWVRLSTAMTCVTAVLCMSGCGRGSDTDASRQSNYVSNGVQSGPVVELSPSQLNTVKIAPVGTYRFPDEKAEVGNIGFHEDPATVQAESTLIGASATFAVTNRELARAQTLGETNGIAQKELEQAISDQQTAQAALTGARDAVLTLGVPDGDIDQMLAAGKLESSPSGRKWAVANVLQSDSPLIRVGQPVEVKVEPYENRTFKGSVSKIYTTIDPNTHREEVRCEIDDPRDELRVGMLANFTIRITDPIEAISEPANGVVRDGDGTMTAWTTTDRRHFTQRAVKTGLQEEGQVQILDGLRPGELVVTDGAIFLDNILQAPPSD
jgi:membrane fusion protein, heavy metal efflux system